MQTEPSNGKNPWSVVATCSDAKSKKAKRSCSGFPVYDSNALYRSGGTVAHSKY
jgi:hypothetical protein